MGGSLNRVRLSGLMVLALSALMAGSCQSSEDADPDLEEAALSPVAVETRTLSTTRTVTASIEYEHQFALALDIAGRVVTRAPEMGEELELNAAVMELSGETLWLIEGTTPMYRDLRLVGPNERDAANEPIGLLEGPDVVQLQEFLLDAGYGAGHELQVDGIFGRSTRNSVKAFQRSNGYVATGIVDDGALLVSPRPLRLAGRLQLGVVPEEIVVTTIDILVVAAVEGESLDFFQPGSTVEVLQEDSSPIPGQVRQTTADSSAGPGSTVWRIEVVASQTVDAELPTRIRGTVVLADSVLAVPVSAVLALAEGGLAVQRQDLSLVEVDVGETADGWIEVRGELSDGDIVMVPK